MMDVDEAVDQLTRVHLNWHDGRLLESDPLIQQLRDARHASIGAGGTRGGGEGSMLNYKAYDTYEEIDGQVRAWLNEYRQPHQGDLEDLIPKLIATVRAEHAGHRIDDATLQHHYEKFTKWVLDIRDLFDPPSVKEITAPCPECGERHEKTETEERRGSEMKKVVTLQAALRITFRPGYALIAECHCCGSLWAGKDRLIELAEGIGQQVDFEALIELASLMHTSDTN